MVVDMTPMAVTVGYDTIAIYVDGPLAELAIVLVT